MSQMTYSLCRVHLS